MNTRRRKKQSKWRKAIAAGMVCLFLVNTVFQGIAFADAPAQQPFALATNSPTDDTLTEQDYAFWDDLASQVAHHLLQRYPGDREMQQQGLARLVRESGGALESATRTNEGFEFVLAQGFEQFGNRHLLITVIESAPSGHGIAFNPPLELPDGSGVVEEGTFKRGERHAELRVVTLRPDRVSMGVHIVEATRTYDFDANAMPPVAAKYGKHPKDPDGLTVHQFVATPPAGVIGELVFAACGDQHQFKSPTSIVIKQGRPLTIKAPGVHQTRAHFEAHKAADGSYKPDGVFHIMVLDAGRAGIREVEFEDGQLVRGRIDDIEDGFSGAPIVLDGVSQVHRIEYVGDGMPALREHQVVWDPATRLASFTAIGTRGGEIVHLTAADLSMEAKPGMGILVSDLADIARELGIDNLILTGGSQDAQQYVAGAALMPELRFEPLIFGSGGMNLATGQLGSDTASYLAAKAQQEHTYGRQLGNIVYATAKEPTPAERILAERSEAVREQFYTRLGDEMIAHVTRGTEAALLIARTLDVSEEEQEMLAWAGLLHDLGSNIEEEELWWSGLRNRYRLDRPIEEMRADRAAFNDKYTCDPQYISGELRVLLEGYGPVQEGVPVRLDNLPESEIEQNIHLIVAAVLRERCVTDSEPQSLGPLETATQTLEESLRIAFTHAACAVERLTEMAETESGAAVLAGLGIPVDRLSQILPIILYHALPSSMPADIDDATQRLVYIMHAGDSIESSNNRYRGRVWYHRERETLESMFFYLDRKLSHGDLSPEVFGVVEAMVLDQDPGMGSLMCRCREMGDTSVLPDYDQQYIADRRFNQRIVRRIEEEMNQPAVDYFRTVGPINIGVVFATGSWEMGNLTTYQAMATKVAQLERLCEANSDAQFTIYAVDDGTEPGILEEIQRQFDTSSRSGRVQLVTIRLQDAIETSGQLSPDEQAVLAGLSSAGDSTKWGSLRLGIVNAIAAEHQHIVITDADNSLDVTQIPLQLQPMIEDAAVGVVAGSRFMPEAIRNLHAFGHEMEDEHLYPEIYRMLGVSQLVGVDLHCGQKAFRVTPTLRECVLGMVANDFTGDSNLLLRLALSGQEVRSAAVSVVPAEAKESSVPLTIDIYREKLQSILRAREDCADLYTQAGVAVPTVGEELVTTAFAGLTPDAVEAARVEKERILLETGNIPPSRSFALGEPEKLAPPTDASGTLLTRAMPRGTEDRNLVGEILIEGDDIVLQYPQDAKPGKTIERFAREIVPECENLTALLESGVALRIHRGARDAAAVTPKANVVKVSEFLARQILEGKAPIALLDKVLIRNELVHRLIQQHRPRSRTDEENLAIEVMATIEEVKGALTLTGGELAAIRRWRDGLGRHKEAQASIDAFLALIEGFNSIDDIYTTEGFLKIARHVIEANRTFKRKFGHHQDQTLLKRLHSQFIKTLLSVQANLAERVDEANAHVKAAPSIGNKQYFGDLAEQLLFILRDLKAINNWNIANDPTRAPPALHLDEYCAPITRLTGPEADTVVEPDFFPEENVKRVAEVVDVGMAHMATDIPVLMSGGAGTRLILALHAMEQAQREALGAGDVSEPELGGVSKPTIPYSRIMHKSPLAIILEALKKIAQEVGDRPVVIVVGPDTEEPILQMLRKYQCFGFKQVIIKRQEAAPVYEHFDATGNRRHLGPTARTPGGAFVESPEGGGNCITTLGEKGITVFENGREQTLPAQTVLEWLDENFSQAQSFSFLQTDMALEWDTIAGLLGTRLATKTHLAAMAYDYPRSVLATFKRNDAGEVTSVAVGEQFTLGTVFATGPDTATILEYAERGSELQNRLDMTMRGILTSELQQRVDAHVEAAGGLDAINAMDSGAQEVFLVEMQGMIEKWIAEALPNATAPDRTMPASAGAFNMSKADVEYIIRERKLKPHVQPKKNRKTDDGTPFLAHNLELFFPDVPGVLGATSVLLVGQEDALPTKKPVDWVQSRNEYAKKHARRLREEFGVTAIGENALIEFSQLFRGTIDPSLSIGNNAGLYLGGSQWGNGAPVTIGANVRIADGTIVIIDGNTPVTIEDNVEFSGGIVIIRGSVDGKPVVIKEGSRVEGTAIEGPLGAAAVKARVLQRGREAVKRVCSRLAGPFILEDVRNAKGELVVPGLRTIVDLILEAEGLGKPEGHFLAADELTAIMESLHGDSAFTTGETPIVGRSEQEATIVVRQEGEAREVRCIEYRNVLYERVVNQRRKDLRNDEIRYLFDHLEENSLARYLLVYLAATHGNGSEHLWGRIVAHAERLREAGELSEEAEAIWDRLQRTEGNDRIMIDARTQLEIGNPAQKPFGDLADIDYFKLQGEVDEREAVGVFSVSGIRQIFDAIAADLGLPRGFPWRLGISTEPTMAAKVHAVTQAKLLIELLTDLEGFLKRIPLSAMKGKTEEEKRQMLEKTKRDLTAMLAVTQAGKHRRAKKRILVMSDSRSTGPALADADIRMLLAMGVEVEYAFVGSVCEAAVYAQERDIDAAIYISASHNDEGYNGLKVFLGDGRVMPEAVANPYIAVLRQQLKDMSNTQEVTRMVNGVRADRVRRVYEQIDDVKRITREKEQEYRDSVITGISLKGKTGQAREQALREIRARLEVIARVARERKLAIVLDPNGGAREDREYFERLGFQVYEMNERKRYDMKHELCPSPGSVMEANEDLENIRRQARREGYNLIGSFHYDTDGDRRTFRPFDGASEFHLRDDMSHICFSIDVIGYVLTAQRDNPNQVIGIVANGPSTALLEELAERFGFVILRTQTGEANVVDGMERLAAMTWDETVAEADRGQKEVFVPQSLRNRVGLDGSQKINVVCAGEASNGSDFTEDLLVRDPLHTIRGIVNFLDPAAGPQLVHAFLAQLGYTEAQITEMDVDSWWDTGESMATIMYKLIRALPASFATDFFTIGGPGMMTNPPSILGLVKDRFDDVFEAEFAEQTCNGLAQILTEAGVPGVSRDDISYEYINYEDEATIGRGNRHPRAPIGRKIGDGGYKVKFSITRDGVQIPIGWIWFRDSLTEAGVTRLGASFVFPASLVQTGPEETDRLDRAAQEAVVVRAYDFLKETLGDAVRTAVADATQEVVQAEYGKLSPALQRHEEDWPAHEFAKLQNDVTSYIETASGEVYGAQQSAFETELPCERGIIEKARFLHRIGRFEQYHGFLGTQHTYAQAAGADDILQLTERYQAEQIPAATMMAAPLKATQQLYTVQNTAGQNVKVLVDLPDTAWPGKRPVALLFHGLSGFKTEAHLNAYAERLVNDGYIVVRPDFSNNRIGDKPNESDGPLTAFSLEGELDDAHAVIEAVEQLTGDRADLSHTIVGGHSYGGLIARRIAVMACAPQTSPFDALGIAGVIDMSGIVSPRGSVKKVLEAQKARGNIPDEQSIDEALAQWRNTDSFEPFGGQRYYLRSWESYSAMDDVNQIPQDIPYIYIVGTQDDGVRCRGFFEETHVNAFLEQVGSRTNGMVMQHYAIGHEYPGELLPRIVDESCVALQAFQVARAARSERAVLAAGGTQYELMVQNAQGQPVEFLVDEPVVAGKRPVVFLFPAHNEGRKEPYLEALADRFVNEYGYVVARLEPRNVADVRAVAEYLRDQMGERVDLQNVIVGGHTFGANIATQLARDSKKLALADLALGIRGVINFSGIDDKTLEGFMGLMEDQPELPYLCVVGEGDPMLSPVAAGSWQENWQRLREVAAEHDNVRPILLGEEGAQFSQEGLAIAVDYACDHMPDLAPLAVTFSEHATASADYVSSNEAFLQHFNRNVATQGEPVLLRIPVESFEGLSRGEIRRWLTALNSAEHLFIELYSMKNDQAAPEQAYAGLGLIALLLKNQDMPDSIKLQKNRTRKNTVSLFLVQRDNDKRQLQTVLQTHPSLRQSIPVPLALPASGERKVGDSLGLVRGSLFGLQLIRVARAPEDEAFRQQARTQYQDLINRLGATDFTLSDEEILALTSDDTTINILAGILERLAGATPADAIPIEERMQIYRHAELVARRA